MKTAEADGIKCVVGEYLPTQKNGMVKDHYKNLGFTDAGGGLWVLETAGFRESSVHIAIQDDEPPALVMARAC
jgi:predicted enzyme involved in methoxymalonyl-ACP biosynthesis